MGLSIRPPFPTLVAVIILAVLGAIFAFALAVDLYRRFQSWHEQKLTRDAWGRYREGWLGLFSDLDEAISVTQWTVGFYTPELRWMPWPERPPSPWVRPGRMGALDLPTPGLARLVAGRRGR